MFFQANDTADDKQAAVLLSVIGAKTYEVLRNLLAPDPPVGKSYAELAAALTAHYAPKPSVIAEGFYFHKKRQAPEESVTDFIAELRRLALYCHMVHIWTMPYATSS